MGVGPDDLVIPKDSVPPCRLPELVAVVVGRRVRKPEPVGLYTEVGVPPPTLV